MPTRLAPALLVRSTILPALTLLAPLVATAAEPAGNVAERLAKVKAELKSDDAAVRLKAIGSLVHSDLSPMLAAEMKAVLEDRNGEVRSTAATAVGNLGVASVP